MGGSGSQLKNLKNWWKFGDFEKFTCIRYWSPDSVNFKVDPKVQIFDIFCHFYPLQSLQRNLFFWYTVGPCEHVGAFFKKNPSQKCFDQNHCTSPRHTVCHIRFHPKWPHKYLKKGLTLWWPWFRHFLNWIKIVKHMHHRHQDHNQQ